MKTRKPLSRPTDPYDQVRDVADWMRVLKKSRATVLKMIANEEIPAERSTAGGHWFTRPGLARAYDDGRWQAPKRVESAETEPDPIDQFRHRVAKSA